CFVLPQVKLKKRFRGIPQWAPSTILMLDTGFVVCNLGQRYRGSGSIEQCSVISSTSSQLLAIAPLIKRIKPSGQRSYFLFTMCFFKTTSWQLTYGLMV